MSNFEDQYRITYEDLWRMEEFYLLNFSIKSILENKDQPEFGLFLKYVDSLPEPNDAERMKKIFTYANHLKKEKWTQEDLDKEAIAVYKRMKSGCRVIPLDTLEDVEKFHKKGWGAKSISLGVDELIHLLDVTKEGLGDLSDEEYTHHIYLTEEAKNYVKNYLKL